MQDITNAILAWYKQNKRNLPWRKTTDPYKIMVSEMMLQQTQVDRVIPKYNNFIQQFPTAKSLAQASQHELLEAWFGLGYNRRALNLQKAAQILQHDCPKTVTGLKQLPGIGLYTARAILAFAFNKKVHVLDTNVKRVFSRIFPQTKKYSDNEWLAFLEQFIPQDAQNYNNAIMEFGALQCTKKPHCEICPMQKYCDAFKNKTQDNYWQPPKQSTFKGSKRWYRSKILKMLHNESLTQKQIEKRLDKEFFTKYTTHEVIETLVKDGFINKEGSMYKLKECQTIHESKS